MSFLTGRIIIYFTSCLQYFIYFTLCLKQTIYFTFFTFFFAVYKVVFQTKLSINTRVKETSEARLNKCKPHSKIILRAIR